MRQEVLRLGITLLVVGLIAALGLGLTYVVTQKKIAEEDRLSEAKAAVAALPGVKAAAELKVDTAYLARAKKAVPDVQKVYTSDKGTIFLINMKGYGGPLVLAIGIGRDGKVAGIATVSNKETIGLGSKALEPGFFNQYKGKTSRDPVEVGKDINAVTSATITSKAVTGEVRAALKAYSKYQQ